IVFANEHELIALYQTKTLDEAVEAVRGKCDIAAITQGASGSLIVSHDQTFKVACHPAPSVEDSTGAGDQYAAGFLFGLARGMDLPTCGKLASLAAAEVISHIGPRPQTSLAALANTQLNLKLAA
ncbi:MAG TPA: PfkB family carbohydrate kinase, partial [Alphaproteobacteria bacterium]